MRFLLSGIAVVVLSTSALPLSAVVTLDAPGHVYTDRETPVVRGGAAGAKFSIADWRGRLTGRGGTFGMDGAAMLPQMPVGYYHLRSTGEDVTFAIVEPTPRRVRFRAGEHLHAHGMVAIPIAP